MVQRLRITFARGEQIKYLSHLELMKMWERMLRRAGWRLVYSQGFNPHPRISFAAPLPVGVSGEAELLEVQLEEARSLEQALLELSRQAPPGAVVREVREVPADAPALQRLLVAARYEALCPDLPAGDLQRGVERVLEAEALPRQRVKESKAVSYDLRPMIRSLALGDLPDGRKVVRMELRIDAQGAGRPDEMLRELGLDPAECTITRTSLLFREGGIRQDGKGGRN